MTQIKSRDARIYSEFGRSFPLSIRSNDFVAFIDYKNIIFYVSPSFKKLLGYSKNELLGTNFKNISENCPLRPRKSSSPVVGKLQHKNGKWQWVESTVIPLTWKKQKFLAITSHDISETKDLEEKLNHTKEEAETLIAYAPVAIYEIDFQGLRFTKVNDAMCRMTGYSREELLTMNPFDLLDDEGKVVFSKRMNKHMNNEKVSKAVDYKVIKKDGSTMFVALNVKVSFSKKQPVGALVIATDVTERRMIEKQLQASEEKYKTQALQLETILNTVPTIIWMATDKKAQTIIGNKAAYKLSRVREGTNMSKSGGDKNLLSHYQIFEDGKVLEPRDMPIQKVASSGILLKNYEMDFALSNGVKKTLVGDVVPLFDSKGNSTGAVAAFMDITNRKKIEQQKDEFLAVASHELKTPITSIKAYTQFLLEVFSRNENKQYTEHLLKMNAQINKLTSLVNDILDITRMQKGKLKLRLEHFTFDKLVEEVIDQLKITNMYHEIETHLEENTTLYGDRERLGQVVANLLSNSLKYSAHGSKVILTSKTTGKNFIFSIKDFGIGISEENQPHIFERFYRVERANDETYPGMGLGLYISSEIINRHGGSIWFESSEGKGSTFYFKLPIKDTTSRKHNENFAQDVKRKQKRRYK